jgi:membrane protein implicated in regulation of membrane protease activity
MDRVIDQVDVIAERFRKPIGAISVIWFALSCAVAARFLTLPDFIPLSETTQLMLSGLFNALWWGFLNPRVERRRKQRLGVPDASKGNINHG